MAAKKYPIVDRKVSDLIPYVNNSRMHSEEQVIEKVKGMFDINVQSVKKEFHVAIPIEDKQ